MTAERLHDIILLYAPIILGVAIVVIGITSDSGTVVGAGGGLLGIPGVSESIKSIVSSHRQPTEQLRPAS